MSACGINNEDMSDESIEALVDIAVDMTLALVDRLRPDIQNRLLQRISEELEGHSYSVGNCICERIWHRVGGEVYRFLSVNLSEGCEYGGDQRWLIYRLQRNDPRPWGRLTDSVSDGDWYASLPFGQWIEVGFSYKVTDSGKAVAA